MLWNVSFVLVLITRLASFTTGYDPRDFPTWSYFMPPLVQKAPPTQQTPLEAMVELTNELAVAMLQDHTFSRGNFAFSPYGVASVLVVLYEGAQGESARQIQRAVGFPSDKDIIRVGFRDIHRQLRTYFSHEGYLSGISLNKQSSSLRPEYKKILRFYGYDVELNHNQDEEPDTSLPLEPTKTTESLNGSHTTESDRKQIVVATQATGTERSTKPEGTSKASTTAAAEVTEKNHTGEVLGDREVEKKTDFPITKPPKTESELELDLEDENNSNCSVIYKGREEGCRGVNETTAEGHSEEMLLHSTEAAVAETKEAETEKNDATTNGSLDNGMLIPQPDDREETTEKNSSPTDPTQLTTAEDGSATTEPAQLTSTEEDPTTTEQGQLTPTEMTSTLSTQMRTLNSSKVKIASQLATKSDVKMLRNEEQVVNNIRSMFGRRYNSWLSKNSSVNKPRSRRMIGGYQKMSHNPELSLQLQNGMYDTHISRDANLYKNLPRMMFLVDGAIDTPVPMMTYSNVFSYAYIPRLRSKAMEFPLDDDRYKLLILLPVERRGLRQLIYDLAGFPLNNVLQMLRPQMVRAIVPSFMVEGFVILTSSLQKLGIWDVFDPRKANLSGMSMDPGLYVRNVEQSVTVVIRNYVEILDIQTRTMAARVMEQEFEATHPFLYFVMDTATEVSLMAGQILDPLNSRIY